MSERLASTFTLDDYQVLMIREDQNDWPAVAIHYGASESIRTTYCHLANNGSLTYEQAEAICTDLLNTAAHDPNMVPPQIIEDVRAQRGPVPPAPEGQVMRFATIAEMDGHQVVLMPVQTEDGLGVGVKFQAGGTGFMCQIAVSFASGVEPPLITDAVQTGTLPEFFAHQVRHLWQCLGAPDDERPADAVSAFARMPSMPEGTTLQFTPSLTISRH